MRSICLIGVQIAVEREGRLIIAIDKYDYGLFQDEKAPPIFTSR